MRLEFNVDVEIDAPSYVQAGEILDELTRSLEIMLDGKGTFDISDFRIRHRSLHELANRSGVMMTERRSEDAPR